MQHSFQLTTEEWIPVWDRDTGTAREVGMTEALTRAHRLRLPVCDEEGIVLLRLLTAALDAVCGPQTESQWDKLWQDETLPADAVTEYMSTWAKHLDLLDPHRPAFQCPDLATPIRKAHQLAPAALGGDSSFQMYSGLSGNYTGWPPGEAARYLLVLLSYDTAGIKAAAPNDPESRGGRVYGAKTGPLGTMTHMHLEGPTLKDTLLLNLPPRPRTAADSPVWERPAPSAHMQERTPAGRMDWLTWSSRRVRLFTENTPNGPAVNAFAVHDGDRLPDPQTEHALAHDPMTAWRVNPAGEHVPQRQWLDAEGQTTAWVTARMLAPQENRTARSEVVDHLVAATQRGVLPPALPVHAVLAMAQHATVHRSNLSGNVILTVPLGMSGHLADPELRHYLAARAWHVDALTSHLTENAARVFGASVTDIKARLSLRGLEHPWRRLVQEAATDPSGAKTRWSAAVYGAARGWIEEQPCRVDGGQELLIALLDQRQ